MEMVISQEIYEQVRAQVLHELEIKKLENRRIDLAAEAIFASAHRKYYEKVIDKYGRGPGGFATMYSADKFTAATKLALELVGAKNSRIAYLHGLAEDANKKAEQILEAILKE